MSSLWVSNPTHNTKSYHYKPDYLSLLLLFFSSRRPPLNPSVVYFLPLFHIDEQRNLQTDLLLKDGLTCFLLCENLLLSLSVLSLCACLTDKAYWTITGVTLPPPPPFVRRQFSHRFGAVCILWSPHYWVLKGTSSSPVPPRPLLIQTPLHHHHTVKWALQQAGNI